MSVRAGDRVCPSPQPPVDNLRHLSDLLGTVLAPDPEEDAMCWQCDNPSKSKTDYLREVVQAEIDCHGYFVQAVQGGRHRAQHRATRGGQPVLGPRATARTGACTTPAPAAGR